MLRIGSVPYINAKPLVDWFHSPDCTDDVEVIYEVPSRLAEMLRSGEVDVCNCSIFESLRAPGISIVPGISISSFGPVKSVRLFYKSPLIAVQTVALDTSSLTSAALTKIILTEFYGLTPEYCHSAPILEKMLENNDAGLIIGDLKLFDLHDGTETLDLGESWTSHTGLPFVYAAWQMKTDNASQDVSELLQKARNWGVERIPELALKWSKNMNLSLDQCLDYFQNAMDYDLSPNHIAGLSLFRDKCFEFGLVESLLPIDIIT